MTDATLPLGSRFRVDTAGAPSPPALVDPGTGACLDHVTAAVVDTDPVGTPPPEAPRAPDRAWLVRPGLDLAVALIVSAGLVLLSPAPPRPAYGLPVVWLLLLLVGGAYEHEGVGATATERARGVLRAGTGLAVACWAATAVTTVSLATPYILTSLFAITAGSLLVRWRPRSSARHATGTAPMRVVVVGTASDVAQTATRLRQARGHGLALAGACLADREEPGSFDVPVTHGPDDAAAAAVALGAGAVVVLPSAGLQPEAVRRMGWRLEKCGIDLCLGMPLLDVSAARTRVASAGDLRLVHVRAADLRGPRKLLKDLAERTFAAFVLCVLLPLLLVLAVAIRHSSPGPAIFRQTRVGQGGRHFTMYKLRTMTADAEQRRADLDDANDVDGALFKVHRDPRVTRIGSLLRRYSLDEVPQLVNVLLGQMSLVGPRPALPAEVAQYGSDALRRLAVRPGLTGLWQVSGRSDLSWEEAVRLDLQYVDNWSLALDLRIFWRTLGAVLSQRGAY